MYGAIGDLIPFRIELNTVAIAGACLWSLALYLGLASLRDWFTEKLDWWFNFAERWMYTSVEEFEKTRPARESQNAFYASIFSIIPFIFLGSLFYLGIEFAFGSSSWSISLGIMACIACGVYELGRRDGEI
jgi:hypothetical protein